jgi:hypothetical protein
LPLEDAIEAMRKQARVKIVDKPGRSRDTGTVFEISFPGSDPLKAPQTTQKLIPRFWDVAASTSRSPDFNSIPPARRTRIAQ